MNLESIYPFIIKDPIRKIFAIIFAFGLWFYVVLDNDYQYVRGIKLTYTNIPDSMIIVDSVSTIDVAFTGRGGSLLSIWAVAPKAQFNLSNSKLGENKTSVKNLMIPIGFADVSIGYPNTASINVTLDKKVTKKIKITVPIKGLLKRDYSVKNVSVFDTVIVTGPRETLINIKSLMTESLSVKNQSSSFTKTLKVLNPSPLLVISKEKVAAAVEIESAVEKSFTSIPLKLIYSPSQKVNSEKISLDTLIVKGPISKMKNLEKRNIEVRIRLTKLSPGEYNLPATIILPEYIKPVYSKPKKFKIKIL